MHELPHIWFSTHVDIQYWKCCSCKIAFKLFICSFILFNTLFNIDNKKHNKIFNWLNGELQGDTCQISRERGKNEWTNDTHDNNFDNNKNDHNNNDDDDDDSNNNN